MGQSRSMQFSAGQKIGSNLWISVSLTSRRERSEMRGCLAGTQLWGLFSCICAFFSPPQEEGVLFKSLQQKKFALLQRLSRYKPHYGLYAFIDVLFTHSATFGAYFRSRNTWWVNPFLFCLYCVEVHVIKFKLENTGGGKKAVFIFKSSNKLDNQYCCWISTECSLLYFWFSVKRQE